MSDSKEFDGGKFKPDDTSDLTPLSRFIDPSPEEAERDKLRTDLMVGISILRTAPLEERIVYADSVLYVLRGKHAEDPGALDFIKTRTQLALYRALGIPQS